jgi:hypothetical protein
MTRLLALAMAAALLGGCGPEEVLGGVRSVEAPAAVQAGQPFTVVVTTGGPDGCWKKERTEVSNREMSATITPYDVEERGRNTGCTQAPVDITHTAELTFGRMGTGVITVRGRNGTGRELSVIVD